MGGTQIVVQGIFQYTPQQGTDGTRFMWCLLGSSSISTWYTRHTWFTPIITVVYKWQTWPRRSTQRNEKLTKSKGVDRTTLEDRRHRCRLKNIHPALEDHRLYGRPSATYMQPGTLNVQISSTATAGFKFAQLLIRSVWHVPADWDLEVRRSQSRVLWSWLFVSRTTIFSIAETDGPPLPRHTKVGTLARRVRSTKRSLPVPDQPWIFPVLIQILASMHLLPEIRIMYACPTIIHNCISNREKDFFRKTKSKWNEI